MTKALGSAFVITLVAVLAAGYLLAHPFQGGGGHQPAGSGTIEACDNAPGGDPSVEIEPKTGENPGNITITGASINGVPVPSSQYTVSGNGGPDPEVTFHNPTPGAPPAGATVCIYGTTTLGDKEWEGELDWN